VRPVLWLACLCLGTAVQAADDITLTLRASAAVYDTVEAVRMTATFHNGGAEPVVIGHPNMSFPHALREGESLRRDPARSRLSVLVEHPDGTLTVLTNNVLRMFEPDGLTLLALAAGGSADIFLGWFGSHYSLGQWKMDRAVFVEPGAYRATLRYVNRNPVVYRPMDPEPAAAWLGELESNTITLTMKAGADD
jgi:hypothetical protein